jgi:hypothetical protein
MDDMRRGLDVEKAEAALKRAAEKATHGTREERSGRFVLRDDMRSKAGSEMQPTKVPRGDDLKKRQRS